MTEEKYIELKDEYLKHITKYMQQEGGLFSHISILGEPLENSDQNAIIHIPIPESIANSGEGKEYFVTKMIPEIAKKVKKEFNTIAVIWASEAWLRTTNKSDNKKDPLENWKDLPIKKEVLMISIESQFSNETLVYEIIRNGMQVTEDGLSDTIELIKDNELSGKDLPMQGRFAGLYKKFIQ